MVRKIIYITTAFCWYLLLQFLGQTTDKAYALALKGMYKNTVPHIKADELLKLIRKHEQAILLDARSINEYNVSHIPGAHSAAYNTFDVNKLKGVPKDTPIIVYCSVGDRSERLGEEITKVGYKQVFNLYGGIFEWINAGLPIFDHLGRTTKVHPHSLSSSLWLHEGEKTYYEAA